MTLILYLFYFVFGKGDVYLNYWDLFLVVGGFPREVSACILLIAFFYPFGKEVGMGLANGLVGPEFEELLEAELNQITTGDVGERKADGW